MAANDLLPDVRAFLDAMAAQPRPPMSDAVIAMIRQMPPGTMPSPDLPVGELAVVRDVVMPGPGGALSLRLYDARATREAGPAVVFYHGGGFVVGGEDTHGGLVAAIARGLDLPVISVDYRLAPEHKFPAAPVDAEAAARWIASNGAAFDREITSLVLAGDSAGGTLTLTTGLALRDAPAAVPVVHLLAIYPGADFSRPYDSGMKFADGYGLTGSDMGYYTEAYAMDVDDWRASPLLAELAGLPPMVVVTADHDPLRDSGRALAAKAIVAGNDVSFIEAQGTIHGFATFRLTIASARGEVDRFLAASRLMLGRSAT